MTFLDKLWEAKKESCANKRDEMHGEGEPANRKKLATRYRAAGWEPQGEKGACRLIPAPCRKAISSQFDGIQNSQTLQNVKAAPLPLPAQS